MAIDDFSCSVTVEVREFERMARTTANEVADYLLCVCREHGDYLTNLKLQKLLYYAQAWYLALRNRPLFDEKIEAWVHGPVVTKVYHRFKKYAYNPIAEEIIDPDLPDDITDHLDKILNVFGKYSAWELEQMTHNEFPWRVARRGLPPDEAGTAVISRSDMASFYRKMSKRK